MGSDRRGFSLDSLSRYWDLLTPAEKSAFRRRQVALAAPEPGNAVLDVGCGTGALSVLTKVAVGEHGQVAGIDIAPGMIAQARRKAAGAGLQIDFRVASVDSLPFSDGRFDLVTSSMMFHHLPVAVKRTGLAEIRRVLKSGGRFYLCDFLAPHPLAAPLMFLLLVWVSPTRFQLLGRLPGLIRQAGFGEIRLAGRGLALSHCLISRP